MAQLQISDELQATRDDVASALIDEGFTLIQSRQAAAAQNSAEFSIAFRGALEFAKYSRGGGRTRLASAPVAPVAPVASPASVQPAQSVKRSIREGVAQQLFNADFLDRRMREHREWQGVVNELAPKLVARANGNGHLATLKVNEDQLNKFLTGLPLEAKEQLAQRWLSEEM